MRNRLFLGIAISAILLFFAVRQVNFAEFSASLAEAKPSYFVPAFFLTIIVCIFRALRWRLLFSPIKWIPLGDLLSVIMVGFLANNLLPARLGEVVMAYLMNHKQGVGKSRSLGTIFLDRMLDVFTLLSFLFLSLLVFPAPGWVKNISFIGVVVLVLVGIFAWFATAHQECCLHWIDRLVGTFSDWIAERIKQVFVMFVDGLASLRDPWLLLKAVMLSVLVWAGLGGGVFLLFAAFGLQLQFHAAVIVMVIVNLGLIIPSSPGFIGTFQFFCVAALALFGIGNSQALSFSVLYHLSQWLPTTLVGLYYLNRESLSLASLMTVRAKA